jgi:hypothetical protein
MPHGAKMPSLNGSGKSKGSPVEGGNTQSGKYAEKTGDIGKKVRQDFGSKPMKLPKGGHTS